ncbi:putative bifunctional diguanylate cyclase/phosphodiesterase [Vallicoccus soli]|uniref:Bifunctional diguanylate cyclase/phosphodiesterase n=1 Tax=Vallicoccus soli TaxID=2339232 RepID=A0A3A3YS66_9ACTN|nr:bifunctional diguanylate cyclase/phosphodiesterase [Vallicoccus soli]RJK94250.1 bifunctional diguanylate cyclase/phosphodiesterase [Vallicoccus soli]
MDAGTRGRDPLRLLVAGCAAAVVLTVAIAIAIAAAHPAPRAIDVLACATTMLCAIFLRLDVRVGSHRVRTTWLEAAIVLAVFVLPGAWVTLCACAAMLLAQRIEGLPRPKVLVNAASATVGAGLASAVYGPLASAGAGLVAMGAVLAAVVFTVVSDVVVSLAVALSQGLRVRDLMREGIGLTVLTTLGNVLAALGVLALLQWEPKLLLALPPLLLALQSAYRNRLDARLERETWEGLSEATSRLAVLDPQAVAERAVADLAALFRAEQVVVEVTDAALGPVRAGGGDGRAEVVRPLRDGSGTVGEVRLHFGGAVALTPREEASLTTYLSALTTAVRNAATHRRRAHEAEHDPLTGLGNRVLLGRAMADALAPAGGSPVVALALLDLDHFKQVNDGLGHTAGDELLVLVAERLVAAAGDGLVARLGGDEFAVLLQGLADEAEGERRVRDLVDALEDPLPLAGMAVRVEPSVGVAYARRGDHPGVGELVRRADVAMYVAKSGGTVVEAYDPARDGSTAQALGVLGELRGAMRRGELVLHYQRKECLRTGRVVGAEALVRWRHPERGLLGPGAFVPQVEASSLVGEFTLHVLDLALAEAATWRREGHDVPVAVNLSARLLLDADLPVRVADRLARHGLAPDALVLEVTETVAKSELEVVDRVLRGLHALGVHLSVDDFGTGWSSMTFLSRTALHEVKIDRRFVAGMLGRPTDAAVVRATVELARGSGLVVVAEGIEEPAQRAALLAAGVEVGQGYLLGRPVPAAEFRRSLERAPVAPVPAVAAAAVPVPRPGPYALRPSA